MGKEIEIKKLPEFEAMVNAGNTTYTGLVEGIGYVSVSYTHLTLPTSDLV